MNYTDYIVPAIIVIIMIIALFSKVDIFDEFIEGAKDGLKTSCDILPTLVLLMTCISMFKTAGGFSLISEIIMPFTDFLGFPSECTPLIFVRTLSGSGAISLFDSIISEHGPDSFIGKVASTMMGSSETTFYTVAVYFGAVRIKHSRYAIPAALMGDATGFIASTLIVRLIL